MKGAAVNLAKYLQIRPFDRDAFESDALDLTVATVRKSSDPKWLRRELSSYVRQRLKRVFDDRYFRPEPDPIDDALLDALTVEDTESVEEYLDGLTDLTANERRFLTAFLYRRDRREESEYLSKDNRQTRWYKHLKPKLKRRLEEDGSE